MVNTGYTFQDTSKKIKKTRKITEKYKKKKVSKHAGKKPTQKNKKTKKKEVGKQQKKTKEKVTQFNIKISFNLRQPRQPPLN